MAASADPIGGSASIGVFWRVQNILVAERTPLEQAEPYGDFLTSRGHYNVWSDWQGLTPSDRRTKGLPERIAFSEYEEHARGRVVFHRPTQTFIIYADRRLQASAIVSEVLETFDIPPYAYQVRSDSHYV